MKSTLEIKEEPGVFSPAQSSAVGSTAEPSQLKKGPWTAAEDAILIDYVNTHGEGNWNAVQKNVGLQRCGKSCRLRWANHLRPNLRKGSFTPQEESIILKLHSQLGNKWARMAAHLPGRTDNEIKNYWNTRIKRRQRAGLSIYPSNVQKKIEETNNHRKEMLMLLQNQSCQRNCSSHISPTMITRYNNNDTVSDNANHIGNLNLSTPPQQLQSFTFPVNLAEQPLTPQLPHYIDNQNWLQPSMDPMLGQVVNAYNEGTYQGSQGPEKLYNEQEFLLEPMSVSCVTAMEPISPLLPSPISNSNDSIMSSLYNLDNVDISTGYQEMKQPVEIMVNEEVSSQPEKNPFYTTLILTGKFSNKSELNSSSTMTDDDMNIRMQQPTSNLYMNYDFSIESSSWEHMPKIC